MVARVTMYESSEGMFDTNHSVMNWDNGEIIGLQNLIPEIAKKSISSIYTRKYMASVIQIDCDILKAALDDDLDTRIRFWRHVCSRVIVLKPETFTKLTQFN